MKWWFLVYLIGIPFSLCGFIVLECSTKKDDSVRNVGCSVQPSCSLYLSHDIYIHTHTPSYIDSIDMKQYKAVVKTAGITKYNWDMKRLNETIWIGSTNSFIDANDNHQNKNYCYLMPIFFLFICNFFALYLKVSNSLVSRCLFYYGNLKIATTKSNEKKKLKRFLLQCSM